MAAMRFDRTGGGKTGRRWRGPAAAALSVAAHAMLLPALFAASDGGGGPAPAPPPILIELEAPPPPPVGPPPGPVAEAAPPAGAAASAAAAVVRPLPAPLPPKRPRPALRPPSPEVVPLPVPPAPPAPTPPIWATVGEAELAGALRAGAGVGTGAGPGAGGPGEGGAGARGSGCDMVGRLERALRGDPEVAAAVARALSGTGGGRALLVWNGDWVTSPGEAGKGLAGVRQAIAVEVAFSPAECQRQPVRGYAVVALADGPGAARLALGPGTWRWSELTGAR